MDELLQQLNAADIRYLLIGGQAMRCWVCRVSRWIGIFFIPPRDKRNLDRLNELLADDMDMPLLPLGPRGENFIQTYQTHWGVLQFHLGLPGVPRFDEAESAAVARPTERGTPVKCLSGLHLLGAKQAANRSQDQIDIEFLLELQRAGRLV